MGNDDKTTANIKFGAFLFLWQITNIILYATKVRYSADADPKADAISNPVPINYAFFQDVHVMIFIGFGFLMTFLRKYSYGAVGFNFVIAAMALQWAVLVIGFWHRVHEKKSNKIEINIDGLVNADFAAGAVLISFGGVIGKTNAFQLMTMALIEVIFYGLNEMILTKKLVIADIGGSMVIHVFGAYFGLSCAWVLGPHYASDDGANHPTPQHHPNNGSSRSFDTIAMVGTLFLWLFWPSFNGAVAEGSRQERAVVNTVLSLCGSCVMAFVLSSILRKGHRFSMVDIQNATLAGGVACGAIADLSIDPWGALLTGCCTGTLSCIGFCVLQELLADSVGLFDTCGIHNLHGMPGVVGGLASALAAAVAHHSRYGTALYMLYPERAPSDATAALALGVEPGSDRSAHSQALAQLTGLGITLAIALTTGTLTGLLLRLPFFEPLSSKFHSHLFDDQQYWEIPGTEIGGETEADVIGSAPLKSPHARAFLV